MKEKILENYFDSKTYTNQEIMQSIEKTKKEFAKKITNISIDLNDSGVYIVTYYFKNKESLWQKIIVKLKTRKKKKQQLLLQDQNFTSNQYGQYGKYKPTKTYKPY